MEVAGGGCWWWVGGWAQGRALRHSWFAQATAHPWPARDPPPGCCSPRQRLLRNIPLPRLPSLATLPPPPPQSLLSEAVEEFIAGGTAPAEQQIRNLVACELAYINTSHPQFVGGNRAIAQVCGGVEGVR